MVKLNWKSRTFLFTVSGLFIFVGTALIPPDLIKEMQYKLIFHNFLESKADADIPVYQDGKKLNSIWNPDTTTLFKDSTRIGSSIFPSNGYFVIRTIESAYYSSPGYLSRYLDDIVGVDYDKKEFESKFLKEIGLKPFSKTLRTANKESWHFWSGAAVEKVFNKYYGSPNNKFQQVTYGFIYDVAAKKYMKDYVKILNRLLVDKKQEWLAACNIYYNKAMQDSTFDGGSESYFVANELLGNKKKLELNVIDTNYLYHPVGELMRRQIDNSLPSIIKCIQKILKDYDPETFRLLKVN